MSQKERQIAIIQGPNSKWLECNGFFYGLNAACGASIYWRCSLYQSLQCKARCTTRGTNPTEGKFSHKNSQHNHDDKAYRINNKWQYEKWMELLHKKTLN